MNKKSRKSTHTKLDTLPQHPNFCMIVPDADELWDDSDSNVVSTGMS